MKWIGKGSGYFRLDDSDGYCGSLLTVQDAAEILSVRARDLQHFAKADTSQDGQKFIDEAVLRDHLSEIPILSSREAPTRHPQSTLDELIIMALIRRAYPTALIEPQRQVGRNKIDMVVAIGGTQVAIEFMGPCHFIGCYGKPADPLVRKKWVEKALGHECVIWPYWIQRCTLNVQVLFGHADAGFASVWSSKAHFGDFSCPRPAETIELITRRFGAWRSDGIGYMYLADHTNKPVHPIIKKILAGEVARSRIIPRDSHQPEGMWLPKSLNEAL